MKWTNLTYHLALAGVVFSVQTASCFATSAADIFNFKKSVEAAESKAIPFDKVSKEKKGNEKGETDTPPKEPPKKREIPDGLVDHPEDFDTPIGESLKKQAIIREFTDDGIPIIESQASLDPNDYIFFDSEARKKRGAVESERRLKREPRMDDEEAEEMNILEMMNGNDQTDHHHHHHNHNQNHHHYNDDDMEWDEEKIAAVSDEAANAVLEALGFGKGAGKYWPDGPSSTDNFVPFAKVRIPIDRRPTL